MKQRQFLLLRPDQGKGNNGETGRKVLFLRVPDIDVSFKYPDSLFKAVCIEREIRAVVFPAAAK
jgi:hypothetical protein